MYNMKLGRIISIILLALAFVPSAHADFYRVNVTRITPQSASGDVAIRFQPGKNEKGFRKKAEAMLLGSDPGTNKSLAVLLSAVTNGKEVIIELEFVPSKTTQTILSTGFIP